MYVETDFLAALIKADDWLHDSAVRALGEYDVSTSILAYAELLVLLYDREAAGYEIDASRGLTNLIELVPVEPAIHEEAILAAATYLEEFDLTPIDALHAGLVTARDDRVLSSEGDYEVIGLERVPLEGTED